MTESEYEALKNESRKKWQQVGREELIDTINSFLFEDAPLGWPDYFANPLEEKVMRRLLDMKRTYKEKKVQYGV